MRVESDDSFVHGLRPSAHNPNPNYPRPSPTILHSVPSGHLGGQIVALGLPHAGNSELLYVTRNNAELCKELCKFSSSITSVTVTPSHEPWNRGKDWFVIATAEQARGAGNFFMTNVEIGRRRTFINKDPGDFQMLGNADTTLWCSAQSVARIAVGASNALFLRTHEGDYERTQPSEGTRNVAFLEYNVVAYSQYGKSCKQRGLHLFDVRSQGSNLRFPVSSRLTSIQVPEEGGMQIVASNNDKIMLYDTRSGKLPLLTIPHVHQGPKLQSTVFRKNLVAAVDRENVVQVYSLRTGRHIKALNRLPALAGTDDRALLTSLSYKEDDETGRETLQACQNGSMLHWTWTGIGDDM